MKIRKVRVGIKDLKTALNEFVEIGKAVEEGKPVKKEKGVYFTSVEAFRKAITPKRLALLKAIKTEKPSSVRQLSKIAAGFDAPILYCMYLDKPMRDHVLLQAIARVNRPYEKDEENRKPCGLVVDFVGIFE